MRTKWKMSGAIALAIILALALSVLDAGAGQGKHAAVASTPTASPDFSKAVVEPAVSLGSWIWPAETRDKQKAYLWKTFELPKDMAVQHALLWITADNGYRLFLDGRQIGEGSDWRSLTEYNVTWLLEPGRHVLAVEGFNDQDQAGIILGLRIELSNGELVEVKSDNSWRVIPEEKARRHWEQIQSADAHWPPAKVVGAMGTPPWWRNPTRIMAVPPLLPIVSHFWQQGWFQIVMFAACAVAVLACLRLAAQVALQRRAQQLLQLERARIARDVHDDLGAGLTQLVLLGEVAQSELPKESETRAQINQLCERARDLSRTLDEILWAVNSRRDTLRDFASYVCKYAQAFLRPTGIRCRLDVESELPSALFDLPIRRNVFRAVKEALHNAAKHSGATELFLSIHRQGGGLLVVVEDNGKGFDLAFVNRERNGLTNMAQRMGEVGGKFAVICHPGKGCRVEFHIPRLHAPDRPRFLKGPVEIKPRRAEEPPPAPAPTVANN